VSYCLLRWALGSSTAVEKQEASGYLERRRYVRALVERLEYLERKISAYPSSATGWRSWPP